MRRYNHRQKQSADTGRQPVEFCSFGVERNVKFRHELYACTSIRPRGARQNDW